MKTLLIVTEKPLSRKKFEEIANRWSASWQRVGSAEEEAVIGRGDAYIFLSHDYRIEDEFEEDEIEEASSILGSAPASLVGVSVGHAEGADNLAEDFAKDLIALCGGYFFYD